MGLQLFTALCFGLVLISPPCQPSRESEIIIHWAETLGEELWKLGQTITKADEIKNRYTSLNVRVEEKNGMQLLRSAVQSVQRMLTRKTDSIKCILNKAENLSVEFDLNQTSPNFTYTSSRYSNIVERDEDEDPTAEDDENATKYRVMTLNEDTHFNYISVNTSYSSVQVPTNIYDGELDAREAISWSEDLDEVFTQNYNSDPALYWQYFCSSAGILRHYPAMAWDKTMPQYLTYDCRTCSWYIEAATCSKDVIILFDNSGSMTGYGNYVAQYTVKAILETLSNNDFLNIFAYNNGTSHVVECFDKLVQATQENIKTFREAIDKLSPNSTANLTSAFTEAFQILSEKRFLQQCKNSNQGCNQMIMLVTDGVAENLTNVFNEHNRFENGTYIPVRVFTYLIGKEDTKVELIKDIACSNRGFYASIKTINEVQQQVLQYINVIARPLVLQEVNHPPTWTHAYIDTNSCHITSIAPFSVKVNCESKMEYKKGKNFKKKGANLVTSVAVPAFDAKINRDNSSYTAKLLGVAGTDVPVADIGKLALPYKLGVNGYAFVVSNNGYLLLHPDLRPLDMQGTLNINYNSVDLVEVEMIDDNDNVPRVFGDDILTLRNEMVNGGKEGSIANLSIKFHYDNMRRVSREIQDYYYAPIQETPFTLGLALPHTYGNTWIKVGDEIKRNQHMDIDIMKFFQGDNWKVHPDWVYCKYHYPEFEEFNNSESELLHFLEKMDEDDWKWSEQYEQDGTENETFDPASNCGRKTLESDAYYCNKELVQLLVFDAKLTSEHFYQHKFDERDLRMFAAYDARLRFVATMSGLTRWQYILEEDSNDTDEEFGDQHTYAIDETWYKSAILQHNISKESFVFSVPFYSENSPSVEDKTVIASLAIFPRDGGREAPGSVVGYEFSHAKLSERFRDITSSYQSVDDQCVDCLNSCSRDGHDCFVIDGSGYVVLANDSRNTGRFFGEVQGVVMKAMVDCGVYQKVVVFDLQAVCNKTEPASSISNILQTPFTMTKHVISWLLTKVIWLAAEFQLRQLWDACLVLCSPSVDKYDYFDDPYDDLDLTDDSGDDTSKSNLATSATRLRKNYNKEEEEYFNRPKQEETKYIVYPCDRTLNLFVLQQKILLDGDGFMAMPGNESYPPYYVALIPHTNMILVVVNTVQHVESKNYPVYSGPDQDPGPPCHKVLLADLPRRRLEGCYTDHELESKIDVCGSAGRSGILVTTVMMALILSSALI